MKKLIYTLLLLSVFSIISCRKDKIQQNIKQYDDAQIQNYIAINHLTGFVKDTAGGDTSGIYYKVLARDVSQPRLAYTTLIPMVYSLKSFDGKFASTDTITNHFYDYAGHISITKWLCLGLQTAVVNGLQYAGGTMEVLVPSHLAFGVSGYGSGSSQVNNNRIAGNQCIDYYIDVVPMQLTPHNIPGAYQGITSQYITSTKYDSLSIANYMRDSSLAGYTRTADGLMYKILTPGTGTDYITDISVATVTYTGQLFDATIFDQYNVTGGTAFQVSQLTQGVKEGLEITSPNPVVLNTKISMLIPSYLAYGPSSGTSGVPPFSCLRFTFVVDAVTP